MQWHASTNPALCDSLRENPRDHKRQQQRPVPRADAMHQKKKELHAMWQLKPQARITSFKFRSRPSLLAIFRWSESCTVNAHTRVPDASLRTKHLRLLVGSQGRAGAHV
jgi:hypothetical protein